MIRLTYARVVYLTKDYPTNDMETARDMAAQEEVNLRLGIALVKPIAGSVVTTITDYDVVWEFVHLDADGVEIPKEIEK